MAKENPFFVASKEQIKPCKATEEKDIARTLYRKVEATFQKVCSTSFGEALTKLPELQVKKSLQLKQKEKEGHPTENTSSK